MNKPFSHYKGYNAAPTHDEEVRCGAGGHPKSTLIRTETTLSHLHHRETQHGFDAVSFRNIRADINVPFLLSECYIAAATHD